MFVMTKLRLLFTFLGISFATILNAQNCDPDCELWCDETQTCINLCSDCNKVVVADNCADATTPSYAELDGFKVNSCVFTPDGPGNLPMFCGFGTIIHNNFWIGFTPSSSGKFHINIEMEECLSVDPACKGIQASLCRAMCTNPGNSFTGFEYETLACVNCIDQTFDLMTMDVIAGLPHYIMIDGCCGDICNFTIHVIDDGILSPKIVSNQDNDLEVVIEGGEAPYEISWDNGVEGAILEDPDPNSFYTASVKDNKNDTRCITRPVLTSIANTLNETKIKINCAPNPSSDFVNIRTEAKGAWKYKLYNFAGQVLLSANVNAADELLDLTSIENGIYYLHMEMLDGIHIEKIVIQ